MTGRSAWPSRILIVRHGESMGNVARNAAMASGAHRIDIADRDIDVPLSPLGEEQSRAVGRWIGQLPPQERPDVVLASPYRRARQTADFILAEAGFTAADVIVDERLREKEFGVLDRLTTMGIAQNFPEQAEFRRLLGKFYHRPPGGESWCDVILRLRSALDTIGLHYEGRRVMIVCHQVAVLCLRYIIEQMDEEEILLIDRQADVANCALTEYVVDRGGSDHAAPVLNLYNFVVPLLEEGTPVTSAPDANVAAR